MQMQPRMDTKEVSLERAIRILTGLSGDEFEALKQAHPELVQKLESTRTTYRQAFTVIRDPVNGRILSLNMSEI